MTNADRAPERAALHARAGDGDAEARRLLSSPSTRRFEGVVHR